MRKRINEWLPAVIILIVILSFALLIRVFHLTTLPVFADEAIYVRWSQVMSAEATLRFLPLSDGKQPLYMWVLMFFVKHFSDPLFIARMESVLCGLSTIVGVFVASYLLFKNKVVSLLAGLLWAVNPIAYFFDRMALVDAMLVSFGIWTFVFAILTAKLKRLDTAMITGFMLGFALLTKSPALFFTLLIPSTWLLAGWSKKMKQNAILLMKLAGLFLVTLVIGYGLYNILRLGPDFGQIASRNQDYVFPISHLWTNPKDPFIFHIEEIFSDWLVKMGPGLALVLFVIGLIGSGKRFWREKLLLLGWFLFPLIVQSEYAKVFTVRYVLFLVPYFLIMIATSVMKTKYKSAKVIVYLFLAVVIIQSLLFDKDLMVNPAQANLPSSERSGYLEEWSSGTGIKEVADYMKSLPAGKQIVVGTEGYFGTLPDGLQMYLDANPKITVIGTGLNFSDVPQPLKDAFKAGDRTYFIVNSDRIQIKPENYSEKGLRLITSYPKALRREHQSKEYILFGPQESLLFFEVIQPIGLEKK